MQESLVKKLKIENITAELVAFFLYKNFYQNIVLRDKRPKKILFIVGCQRSGTSLMTRIFFRDIRVKVYRESSKLSSKDPQRLRLNPLSLVKARIERDKASLIVLKPLVESQNVLKLLEYFPGSYALWLFRHYKDVASSNLKIFGIGNGIDDLRPILNNDPNNWRSEQVSTYTRSIIQRFFSEELSLHDAAALFWLARNQLFYDLNLEINQRILMCRYEDLVSMPERTMVQIYEKIGLAYPKDKITKEVHARSVKKGSEVILSPEIEKICADFINKLDYSYSLKMVQ